MVKHFDVIVLGGGAAGLMCAIEAGKRGRRVAVLERADRLGKKILISGGGRCNFTNLYCKPENFISANPHFCKSALSRYTPADFIALVERYKIPYHEKTKGQLFCDGSSREIVALLEEECRRSGVAIFFNVQVNGLRREGQGHGQFVLSTGEQEFRAESLVVATGGLSIPRIGATAFGYEIARQFDLKVQTSYPGLVPLTFAERTQVQFTDLAGVSCEVRVSCGAQSFQDKMLFTHRGLSGPAILQISSYWKKPRAIVIDLAPKQCVTEMLRKPGARRDAAAIRVALRTNLPQRLGDRWLDLHTIKQWTNASLDQWEAGLHAWEFVPDGTEGFGKAEVTGGGVDTSELSSKTMECERVPGLFFVGEVVDVTGQLGGFNFQWAWASGYVAGQAA
jgi:predicted Rossmann fold flavoprotein